jgi:hypothetical protein
VCGEDKLEEELKIEISARQEEFKQNISVGW